MKYFELDKEEQDVLDLVERGEWQSVEDLGKTKSKLRETARTTLSKTRNINIRLSERVVQRLKTRAQREGIPYQTLAASILHRDTHGGS